MKPFDTFLISIAIALLIVFFISFLLEDQAISLWAFLTDIGEPRFLIVLAILIYFFSYRFGSILLALILFNISVNLIIKWSANVPRPPNPKIEVTGPSFPSNHAQSTASFWAFSSLNKRGYSLIFLSIVYVFFISYSRIALNVHYPIDVIGGSLLGVLISFSFYLILKKLEFKKFNLAIYSSIFFLSLIAFFVFKDEELAKTSFFALGFLSSFLFNQSDIKTTVSLICFVIWLLIAISLLIIPSLQLFIQYFLLGVSAPVIRYAIPKILK